jgi:F-type H+-transporting ATPase subunit epsilon
MAENLIKIDVISPEGMVYEGDATLIGLRGADGELGITPGHTQLLTSIKPGPLRIVLAEGEEEVLFVAGGILEVQPNRVIVLADIVERPRDVNELAAQEAKQKAEETLKDAKADKVSLSEAQNMLIEAEARLKVLSMLKGKK